MLYMAKFSNKNMSNAIINQTIEDLNKIVHYLHAQEHEIKLPPQLTYMEMDMVLLFSNGFSNKEVAAKMKVSVRTIEMRRHRICIKLECVNITHAVSKCFRRGWLK